MTDEPTIAHKGPATLELEPGTYHWCRCGLSTKQPFCSGAHKTTSFTPVRFEIAEKKRVSLCQCKHTSNQPYCDGTHKRL